MTDKELLELAARAAGIVCNGWATKSDGQYMVASGDCEPIWNPLKNDGDALRLAVDLNLDICIRDKEVGVERMKTPSLHVYEPIGRNHYGAVRRCIVRAAAEIGKQKG